jgi:putative nucleotidyltransferase with HDIG domain
MATIVVRGQLAEAQLLAEILLAGHGDRWRHTVAVARRAEELCDAGLDEDPDDREALIAAAWLHDIGYSPALAETGFHNLDGAAFLDRNGWPERICALVAHHSGGRYVARAHGLLAELDHYPAERSIVADALTYADQTVGPRGQRMSLEERMAEMLVRRGPDSVQAKVHRVRAPYLRRVAERVESRLRTPAAD